MPSYLDKCKLIDTAQAIEILNNLAGQEEIDYHPKPSADDLQSISIEKMMEILAKSRQLSQDSLKKREQKQSRCICETCCRSTIFNLPCFFSNLCINQNCKQNP
jgi:hypothetical protein